MHNELEWEKVLEWPQHETTYIIHIITSQQQISIEVQDKFCGDIWHAIFLSQRIQELTTKAQHPKKYAVFAKMLHSALLKTSQSLTVEILSYKEMVIRSGKPGSQAKAITPQQASKRYLILNYVGEFQKMQFPLTLVYNFDAEQERLKLTIKRMSQEMSLLRQGYSENELTKENSLLKYENQSLKNKLKGANLSKSEYRPESSNLQQKIDQMQRELNNRHTQNSNLQQKLSESQKLRKESEQKLKKSQQTIQQLQEKINQMESGQNSQLKIKKKMNHYEEKIEEMITQMNELSAQLVYCKQKEKKSQLKISTLQKELQKMMNSKRAQPRHNVLKDSSPEDKKSERALSIRSGRSNTSQKSLGKTRNINSRKTYNVFPNHSQLSNLNNSNSKKKLSNKKSSIYDSDTESSRLRRMANNRSSPYRQSAAVNTNRSKRPNNQRSRSKSRQRVNSPKPSVTIQSQMMTDGFQSSSEDEDYDKIEGYLKDLKQRKGTRNNVKQKQSSSQGSGSKIQKRLQTLEQMIRKTAQATRIKQ